MATKRPGKGEQANGGTNGGVRAEKEEPPAATDEMRKARLRLKEQTRRDLKRRADTIRWIAIVVLLVVAAVCLYYYFTSYHVDPPPSQAKRKADKAKAKSGTEKTASKQNKEKTASKQSKEKTAKQSKEKTVKQNKEKEAKSKKTNKEAKKNSPPQTKEAKKEKVKRPSRDKPVEKEKQSTINLNDVRLLRRPFSPSDPDKPYVVDILAGDELLKDEKYTLALEHFNSIIKKFPQSPRALYGKALVLTHMAEEKRSNKLMDSAIDFFYKVALESAIAKSDLRVAALVELADRAQARGKTPLAIKALEKLSTLKSDDYYYSNQLGVAYLAGGNKRKAKTLFKKSLETFPDNTFAKAQLGYIFYVEKRYEQALPLLLEGIRKDESVKQNPKFYLYAGDTLMRLNRSDEAQGIYGEAVSKQLFPSVWQRSIYNEPGLRAQPWWSVEDTGYKHDIDRLVQGMGDITREAMSLFDEEKVIFSTKEESSPHFVLFQNGKKNSKNCLHTPKTCALIESFPEAAGCKRGAVKLSALPPLSHISPFVGPTNSKLQVVMALDMDSENAVRIRLAEDTRLLQSKQVAIVDESFEQELWYTGSSPAVLLTVDVWHPDLSEDRMKKLGPL